MCRVDEDNLDGGAVYTIAQNVTWKDLNKGIVLLNLTSGNYYTLNESATMIFRALMEGKDESAISTQMLAEYDSTEEQVRKDLREQIDFLLQEELIQTKGGG